MGQGSPPGGTSGIGANGGQVTPLSRVQDTTDLRIQTPFGPNVLLVKKLVADERLNGLSIVDLELVSDDHGLDFEAIVGEEVTIVLDTNVGAMTRTSQNAQREPRYFRGIVTEFCQVGEYLDAALYTARVAPWLWLLTQRVDCRIFTKMTVPNIVHEVIQGHGFESSIDNRLTNRQLPREYVVQYRESDYDFIARLLELEGICFYFHHTDGDTKLVLTDFIAAHDAVDGYEALPFRPVDQMGSTTDDVILNWSVRRAVGHERVDLRDYAYNIAGQSNGIQRAIRGPQSNRELYEYPGGLRPLDFPDGFADCDPGTVAQILLEAHQAAARGVDGATNARGLYPGCLFRLLDHPRADYNNEDSTDPGYMITSMRWQAETNAFSSGGTNQFKLNYSCEFNALDADIPYRPLPVTPKAKIDGVQTAIVVGPSDSPNVGDGTKNDARKACTDAFGRVKVKFHWDRSAKRDGSTSRWVRVSQQWAGKGYGSMMLPHIGQEVVVDFIEGDPDHPIITGRVYNGKNGIPPRQDNADQTHIWNHDRVTVARDSFDNEIVLDATSGSEEIWLYSPNHSSAISIGYDGINQSTTKDESSLTVGDSISTTIGASWENTIGVQGSFFGGAALDLALGVSVGVFLGASFELSLGVQASASVGAQFEYAAGAKLEWSKESGYEVTGEDLVKSCKDEALIDSLDTVTIVGGNPFMSGTPEGTPPTLDPKKEFGYMIANDQRLLIGFGPGIRLNHSALAQSVVAPAWKTALATTVAAGGAAGMTIGAAAIDAESKANELDDDSRDNINDYNLDTMAGITTVGALATIVGGGFAARYGKKIVEALNIERPFSPEGLAKNELETSKLKSTTLINLTSSTLEVRAGRSTIVIKETGEILIDARQENGGVQSVSMIASDITLTAGGVLTLNGCSGVEVASGPSGFTANQNLTVLPEAPPLPPKPLGPQIPNPPANPAAFGAAAAQVASQVGP